ncbi:tetratricopeptide repeat protein [uncultured Desulfovibrio sp.]|uniref:tetratricopeptide repeat protein n=1 Tax=uncultured Desulfovibrio sp. TaxID=167968 RepID=UPI001C39A63B|nr:tetratricopeptide repeat protein [uncultured Desulfovibrio sp.]HIX39511.1 tetratricopeptide repeat protein [Candidatus Desulfovibrio intestinigallinarum]
MAKKHSRKSAPPPAKSPAKQAPAATPVSPSSPTPPASVPAPMVRRSTCFFGMGAMLVFGVLLGSMTATFMHNTPSAPAKQQTAAAPAQPAPAKESIPPELQQRIAELQNQLASKPNDAELLSALGSLYFDTNQPARAIEAYEASLRFAPGNVLVMTDLGIMYREIGNPEKAVSLFREVIALKPDFENALFNLGVVLNFDLHRHDEARAAWQQLLNVNPAARTPNGDPVSEVIKTIPKDKK